MMHVYLLASLVAGVAVGEHRKQKSRAMAFTMSAARFYLTPFLVREAQHHLFMSLWPLAAP